MNSANSHHYTLNVTLAGEAFPLLRIILILRKFMIPIESVEVHRNNEVEWGGTFVLDLSRVKRIGTVFKKIVRLFDVIHLNYQIPNSEEFISLK